MHVTLATHCHARDLPRLHAPGVLEELIDSHGFDFDEIIVVHQRCGDLPYQLNIKANIIKVEESDYPILLRRFGMNPDDEALNEICHGWSWQWFWQHHCVNHLAEILAANSDFIVFCDADCRIQHQPSSWVEKGIDILNHHSEVFMVCPSEGGHEFLTKLNDGTRLLQMTSQQLFMARTSGMKALDFTNLQWDGKFIDGGPMAEWYGLAEGWLYRYMKANDLYRAILPEDWRYWHLAWH